MKRIYGESGQYSIVEENELFGIVDNSGHLLLPLEYDRITVAYGIKDGFGFILCKNGKFGYVEFGGREHLNEYEDRVVPDDPNGCALAFCRAYTIGSKPSETGLRCIPSEKKRSKTCGTIINVARSIGR